MQSFKTLRVRSRLAAGTLLPHEWVFCAFLLITALRLALQSAARAWSPVFFGCLAAALLVVGWTEHNPTPWRWRVRLLIYYVLMGICFFSMRMAVPLLGRPRVDGLLLAWDRDLLGETPAV